MAKHLVDKTGCPVACQKRSEELTAIRWIWLKITGGCWRVSETTVSGILYGPVGFKYRT